MSGSPGKAPPTDGTPPDQMIPNDPIGITPPPNPNRPPNEPDRIRNDPNRAVPDDGRSYQDDYRTPPNERIEDVEMPNIVPVVVPNIVPVVVPNIVPVVVPNVVPVVVPNVVAVVVPGAPNVGIYDNVDALLAANLSEQQHMELYMRENLRQMQLFSNLIANCQRNNEQEDERIDEQAQAQGYIPQGYIPTGRKILGRAGGGIKVDSSTQTLPDTRGVDNAWLHDSRRRADALCEEIFNLINRLYHASGIAMNHRHSIPKTPQKKSVNSGTRSSSAGDETEEDKRAAAQRRFYFKVRRDMSGISNSAIYLRNSIPFPRPDEEQRLPSPESPPVLLPVQRLAEAAGTSAPPLEQQQEDMAASGFQRDIASGLANMTLDESDNVWYDQENFSADSNGKKTPRRKPLRNSPTEGHVPQQRFPLSYKSPHPSASKPHTKRVKSAQKVSGKDNRQQPCTSATGRPEAVNTGTFGARPKISSTSVWSRGYIAVSTPGKQSEVSAVSPTSTIPIAQSTYLASGVTTALIGQPPSQDSRVPGRETSSALGIASSQSSASDIVKEAASEATSAMFRELRGIRSGVYKKTYSSQTSSATGGSGADSSSQTSSGEASQYQRTRTKSIERPRPVYHTSDSMGKRKAPKAPTCTSRETRGIRGVLKGKNIECVIRGKSQSSQAPKVSSASGREDTRGVTRVPKEAATGCISKGTSSSQASSKSGTSSSSQMSSKSGESRRTNKIPHSRQVSDAVGKKKATQVPKFTSTEGRENRGVSGALKGTNTECALKERSRTSQASRVAITPGRETSGATSGGNSSTGMATGVTSTVSKGAATTSLPKGDNVTSSPKVYSSINSPKVASASRVPKRRLSDQTSNAGVRAGGSRTTVLNPDDISLGLLRPRLPYLVTDPTPVTLSRSASDLTDKKPTSEPLKKKPFSY